MKGQGDKELEEMLWDNLPPQYLVKKGPTITQGGDSIAVEYKLSYVPKVNRYYLSTNIMLELLEERFGLPNMTDCGFINRGKKFVYRRDGAFSYDIELVNQAFTEHDSEHMITLFTSSNDIKDVQDVCDVINTYLKKINVI